jgi:hypothetical protein
MLLALIRKKSFAVSVKLLKELKRGINIKIAVCRLDKPDGTSEIAVAKDFRDIKDSAEVSHLMMLVKEIEFELMDLWWKKREEENQIS